MKVRYKGNTLIYTKGATLQEVIETIKKRIKKRDEEMRKREWIVKEFKSLEAKQIEDRAWLSWLESQDPDTWMDNPEHNS